MMDGVFVHLPTISNPPASHVAVASCGILGHLVVLVSTRVGRGKRGGENPGESSQTMLYHKHHSSEGCNKIIGSSDISFHNLHIIILEPSQFPTPTHHTLAHAPTPSHLSQFADSKIIFAQKVENDTIRSGGVGGVIEAMPGAGLDIGLKIRGAAEIGADGLVEDARAIAAAEDGIVLAGNDERGPLEAGRVALQQLGGEGDQLADGERLLGGVGKGRHAAVVGGRFEKWLDGAEQVARGDVAAIKGRKGPRALQASDPRRKLLEDEL